MRARRKRLLPHLDVKSSKRSNVPIRSADLWSCPNAGSSTAPLRGSIAAEGSPRIGRISTERRSRSCASPQSASCSENYAIRPELSGQTLRDGGTTLIVTDTLKRGSAGHRLGQMSRFVTRKTVQNRSRRLPSAPPGAEADVARQNDGLCTRLDAELAEHGGHVITRRAFADAEPPADRGVVEPQRDQLQHLGLAGCEV